MINFIGGNLSMQYFEYRLDKTAFKMMTFKEADASTIFDKNTPYAERIRQVHYLISQAYQFSLDAAPRFDKSYFRSRKPGK